MNKKIFSEIYFFTTLHQILKVMATKIAEVKDPRTEIADYLKENGIKQTWLADRINMSNTHLHFLLKCERDLTEDNRAKINVILGTQF